MKIFISIVLSLAAGICTTSAQGYIGFDSYNSYDLVQTTFGAGVAGYPAGYGLTSGWTAGLLYSLSPVVDAATASSADAAAPLNPAWSVAPNTAFFGEWLGGYYTGPPFILSDGFDGQVVYFEVIAFETGAAGANSAERYMNSTVRGHSAAVAGVLGYPLPKSNIEDHMQPFSVFAVPEPSALALAVLGLAALMAYRRKHA
jgi:PEP-CTERM motif